MTEKLSRVALVTGGGRGIGRAVSLQLAKQGHKVAINYRRDEDAAHQTVEEINSDDGEALAFQADVIDYDQLNGMVDEVTSQLGPISILINNAGIASRGLSVADTDPAEPQRVLAVHAIAAHHLCKLVLPSMRIEPRGDIVMVSSVATRQNGANGAPYNMAKAALESLALTLSKEEREHNIRVNVVAPGLVETEMGRRLVRATMGISQMRELDSTSPFGRVCQPEDVASVITFLTSESSSYVTGEIIYVDGGG